MQKVLYFNLLYLRRNGAETEIPVAAQIIAEHPRTNAERIVQKATVHASAEDIGILMPADRIGSRILKQIVEKLCMTRTKWGTLRL